MKKYHLFILQGLFLLQCSGNAQTYNAKETLAKSLAISNISNPSITAMMKASFASLLIRPESLKKASGIPSFTIYDFDFVYLYKSEKKGETEIAYSAAYRGTPAKDKYAFTVFVKNGLPERTMLIRTSADRSLIGYFDLQNGRTAELTRERDNYAFSSKTVELLGNAQAGKTTGNNCGQAVIDCINDVFSKRGWLSVWATIQSIFVPATGVAIALGCIAANCK